MAKVADVYLRDGPCGRSALAALHHHGWDVKLQGIWDGNHNVIPTNTKPGWGDLIVCCHWPRMIPKGQIANHRYGGLNLHPNLSLGYKVDDPVGRALEQNCTLMSVACHRLTNVPDEGEILAEHWRTVPLDSEVEYVYELLRPLYESTLREALGLL